MRRGATLFIQTLFQGRIRPTAKAALPSCGLSSGQWELEDFLPLVSSRNHSVYNFLVIVLPQKQFFTWPQAVAHVQIQARTQQVPCGFLKPFSWVVFSSLLCLRNLSHLSCLVCSALISTCSAQMLDLTGCFFCGCPWSGNRLQLERPGGPGHLVCFPRLRGHSPALPYASV